MYVLGPQITDVSEGKQMTTTSTGLATMPCQELAAAQLADLIMPGDRGYAEALKLLSQRC